MSLIYKSIAGQSIYDVCLQTYGSLDFVFKLMQDNAFTGLDTTVSSGQPFTWDSTLVVNQQLYQQNISNSVLYATDVSALGSVFYVVNGGNSVIVPPTSSPFTPSPTKKTQMVLATSYTSNADGTTVINPVDINGNPLTGLDIVQIEKEIKPLKAAQYVWNNALNTLTLIGGVTVDLGETLFILYSKLV